MFGVLLIWTGVAWLTGVGLTTGLAVGLVILGLGFVLGSFVGGSRALILPALLVALALAITAFIDIPFSGPIGEQYWSPDTRTELEAVDAYDVSMGEGTLDLSELALLRRETSVTATVGLGHLVVLVPQDQDVTVNTEVGAGDAMVFGEEQNGVGFETHDRVPRRRRDADPRPRGGHGTDRGATGGSDVRDEPTRHGSRRLADHDLVDARARSARTARRSGRCRRR